MSNIEESSQYDNKSNISKQVDLNEFQFASPAIARRHKKEKAIENSLDDSAMTSVGNESENSRKVAGYNLNSSPPAGIDLKNSSEDSLEEGEIDNFQPEDKKTQHLTRKHKRSESADDEIPFNRNKCFQNSCDIMRNSTSNSNAELSTVTNHMKNKFTFNKSNTNNTNSNDLEESAHNSDEDDYTKIINSRLKRDNFQLNLNGFDKNYFTYNKNENYMKKNINDEMKKSQKINNFKFETTNSIDQNMSETFSPCMNNKNISLTNSNNYSAKLEKKIRVDNFIKTNSSRSQNLNTDDLNSNLTSLEFFDRIDPELKNKMHRNYQCEEILNTYKNFNSNSSPLKNACISLSESHKQYREVHEEEKAGVLDKQIDTEEKLNSLAQNAISKLENPCRVSSIFSQQCTNKSNQIMTPDDTIHMNVDNNIEQQEKNIDMSELCGIMSLPDDREDPEVQFLNIGEINTLGTQADYVDINAVMTVDEDGRIFNMDTLNSNSLISDINRTQSMVVDEKESYSKEYNLQSGGLNLNNSQKNLQNEPQGVSNFIEMTIDDLKKFDLNKNITPIPEEHFPLKDTFQTIPSIEKCSEINESLDCQNHKKLKEITHNNSSYTDSTNNKKPQRKKGPRLYPTFFKEDTNDENYKSKIMEIDDMMRAISINDETKKRMRMNFMNQVPTLKNKKDAYFNHSFLFFYLNSFTFSSVLRKLKGREFKLNLILDIDSTILHADYENKHLLNNQSKFPSYPVIAPIISGISHRLIISMRKGVQKLLEYCSQFCNIYVYTHGQEAYALEILKVLEEKTNVKISQENLIALKNNTAATAKSLRHFSEDPRFRFNSLILDDNARAWKDEDLPNLIQSMKFLGFQQGVRFEDKSAHENSKIRPWTYFYNLNGNVMESSNYKFDLTDENNAPYCVEYEFSRHSQLDYVINLIENIYKLSVLQNIAPQDALRNLRQNVLLGICVNLRFSGLEDQAKSIVREMVVTLGGKCDDQQNEKSSTHYIVDNIQIFEFSEFKVKNHLIFQNKKVYCLPLKWIFNCFFFMKKMDENDTEYKIIH